MSKKQPSLNDMVRHLLKRNGGNQTKLGNDIGVLQNVISRLNAGESMPKISYKFGKAIETAYLKDINQSGSTAKIEKLVETIEKAST